MVERLILPLILLKNAPHHGMGGLRDALALRVGIRWNDKAAPGLGAPADQFGMYGFDLLGKPII